MYKNFKPIQNLLFSKNFLNNKKYVYKPQTLLNLLLTKPQKQQNMLFIKSSSI